MTSPAGQLVVGRRPTAPPRIAYLYLAIMVLSWACNWPLMKLALHDAPPLTFVLLRLACTLALMAPPMMALRVPLLPIAGERLGLLAVGLLQVGGFLVASIIGLALVPAGRAIILAYTMPLWAIPLELWLDPTRFGRWHLLGAALGFAGLILFMNPALVDWNDLRALGGNVLLVLAAVCWALGSSLYRRRAWRTSFWTQTFWQLAVSAPVIAVIALPALTSQPVHWTVGLVAILAYNCVVTTALGYFLWNRVLAVMPAGTAGQVMALTPVGGFLISTALFGGVVTADVIFSIGLIVAGIVLTLRG